MTEDLTLPEGGEQQTPASSELDSLIEKIKADPAKTAADIKELRTELKRRRETEKEADRKRAESETLKLEQDRKFEELSTQLKGKLAEVEPKAARLDEYETFLNQQLERRLAALPPQWRDAVPEYDDPRKVLEWLDRNEAKMRLPSLVNTGAGQQGDRGQVSKQKVPMTPEFLATARKTGRSMEQAQKSWDREHNPD